VTNSLLSYAMAATSRLPMSMIKPMPLTAFAIKENAPSFSLLADDTKEQCLKCWNTIARHKLETIYHSTDLTLA